MSEEIFIKMIFSNLLKNAVEALGSTGTITIETSLVGEHICATLTDSGSQAFHPSSPHGSGLGLKICHFLLCRMGGKLDVSPGQNGWIITVYLPLPRGYTNAQ